MTCIVQIEALCLTLLILYKLEVVVKAKGNVVAIEVEAVNVVLSLGIVVFVVLVTQETYVCSEHKLLRKVYGNTRLQTYEEAVNILTSAVVVLVTYSTINETIDILAVCEGVTSIRSNLYTLGTTLVGTLPAESNTGCPVFVEVVANLRNELVSCNGFITVVVTSDTNTATYVNLCISTHSQHKCSC